MVPANVSPLDVRNGYWFDAIDLPRLVVASYYPERTDQESAVIRDYLEAHGTEFDRLGFSVRVGQALAPDPTHLIGVQRSTIYSTRKRIDFVGIKGQLHTLVEAKQRVQPSAIGQILTYRKLYLEEHTDVHDAKLIIIGRYSDSDTVNSATAHGIDVLIYTPPAVG
jgi:hypothetical protein